MKKEKLFECFMEGIAVVIALYEISRTGKRSRRIKK